MKNMRPTTIQGQVESISTKGDYRSQRRGAAMSSSSY